VVRAGGRVVKNVAGFDLVRLVTGAWGTLGVLTEITVRLRALPEEDATLALPLPPAAGLGGFLERVRAARLAAWALELVNAPLAAQLGVGPLGAPRSAGWLLARVAGSAPLVAGQRAALGALGDAAPVDGAVWDRLRTAEPARPWSCAARGSPPRSPGCARRCSRRRPRPSG
jgi:glycolate oxidase FAD binding subunit